VDVHFAYAYRGRFVASAFQSFRQRLTSHHGKPYHSNVGNYLFRFFYYNAARWLMEISSLRRAQHLIMPSRSTRQEFIRHYKVDPSLTTLVYPGIDFSRFTLLPSRSVARQRLRLSEGELCLLYVGFSTPRKGVEYLAQALKVMHVPASLLMVGKWEAGYQEKFLSILGDASSRVKIIGYVSDSDLLDYFAAADAFVLPTLLEGFGIPLVEAMATGLPVVTTTGGSAGEIVGDAGLIVQAGESIELAEALDRVLSDRDLACQMRTLGLERARNLFDERRTITELEAVFERALQAGTR
jgi:glycosyltransferase involved in cell wall biosynthesis